MTSWILIAFPTHGHVYRPTSATLARNTCEGVSVERSIWEGLAALQPTTWFDACTSAAMNSRECRERSDTNSTLFQSYTNPEAHDPRTLQLSCREPVSGALTLHYYFSLRSPSPGSDLRPSLVLRTSPALLQVYTATHLRGPPGINLREEALRASGPRSHHEHPRLATSRAPEGLALSRLCIDATCCLFVTTAVVVIAGNFFEEGQS